MKALHLRNIEVVLIVVLNAVVFVHQEGLSMGKRILFDDRFGAVPDNLWNAWASFRETGLTKDVLTGAIPLVTASYLHADITHIGANMLFFWIFANVLSHAAGRTIFLCVYFLAGIIAVLVYARTNPGSDVPMIGASGAIAGLEGAYFAFVFRWEMPPARVWPLDGPVPASRLALVAVLNFVVDAGSFFGRSNDHIAYGAHVGGFVGGAIIAMAIASFYQPKRAPA